ncbi:2-oxo acid dehydrogenase subunit E2 [Pleionea mediterranea]|uniref:Dihydrolipoamide acetyltransferase component of pyruvate dehydrogenase complex n=1 Tax=Pleionea mediterranea TaxID=523701 RepID=A0A316FJT8_9GAMM|nr:2-oxo acid dehydrogenase subunit E2 [Pleionea mediterranea]PWK49201.1 pyruvate dehydrogenase E2 component (dihydrolipoamide acetyltransferase) [Pleionea mediterranea]
MNIFNLPDLGEGLPDAEVVRWLVKEGDTVSVDQPMVEMETAKAVVEVPSPFDGKVTKLHGQPGDVIQVGAPLVEFDGDGSSAAAEAPAKQPAAAEEKPADKPAAKQSSNGEVFKLPDLGEGLPDAEVVRWLVKQGDEVTVDQPMVEMETAKAVVEVPSPVAGTIGTLHGQEGDVIQVGAPLVTFAGSGAEAASDHQERAEEPAAEEKSSDAGTVVGAVEVGDQVVAESADSVARALARKLKVDLTKVTGTGKDGKITQADVKAAAKDGSAKLGQSSQSAPTANTETSNPLAYKASPAVRALAGRLGVDLGQCNASGRKGSITRDDVEQAAKGGSSKPAAAQSQASSASSTTSSGGSRLPSITVTRDPQPVRGARRAMAQGMAHSHATVVPTTLVEDVNISAWPKGTDSLARYIRALVVASRAEPALNAWFDGDNMEKLVHPDVNVGIAVDTPDGLYVPVVHNADQMSMAESRAQVQVLRDKIANKGIKPDDLANATITLSNFGSIAGRYGTPVVSPPQVAILGTGRFRNELQLTDKGIMNQKMLPLSLTFDHRACTGGEAARFLAAIMEDLAKAN